jgi:type III pantothenate kinase
MLLIFDIGNTSTMAGLYRDGQIVDHFRTPSKDEDDYTVAVVHDIVEAELRRLVGTGGQKSKQIDGVAICSVVPELTGVFASIIEELLGIKAWVMDHTADLGLQVAVDKPFQAGADRLANAVALKNLYGYPGFVIDLGTSTNFDVVDSAGNYIGGAIAPGVKTSAAELFRRASRLFPVKLSQPEHAIGRNTTDAMKSGIFYGSLGLIDHIASLISAELNHPDLKIVATGGFAEIFAPHSQYIQTVDTTLTLKGTAMAYERNNRKECDDE